MKDDVGHLGLSSGSRSIDPVLIEQIRLFFDDAGVERLELEPPGLGRADDRVRLARRGVADQLRRLAGTRRRRFGQDLHLARPLHRDEPPRGLVHGLAHGQQAVVLQDGRLVRPQRVGNALALVQLHHHPAKVIVQRMVVENAQTSCVSGSSLRPSVDHARP